MAHAVRWSATAADDLEAVAVYIGRNSGAYARDVVREALRAAESLTISPERGRMTPETHGDPRHRELIVKRSYRLLYRIQENGDVIILGFVHGARDLAALWSRYERDPQG